MTCDEFREALSAELDGEAVPLRAEAVEGHLRGCVECRAWAARVAAINAVLSSSDGAALGAAEPPAGHTEAVLRAVSGELVSQRALRRQERSVRAGLVMVSAVQLVLAVPVLVFGHDHTAPLHVAHEVGSFDAALALGMAAAARRPRLAAGMLPLVGAITLLLLITAGVDLAAGRTDVLDETPHLLDAAGWLLLRRLSVLGASGPPGAPAMLFPVASRPRLAGGSGLGASMSRRLGRLGLVGLLSGLTVVGVAAPASAHTVHDGDDPSNWRSTITSVSPAVPGLAVAIAEGGQRMGVTVSGGSTVVVSGFYGEPFLRLQGGTVSANTRSLSAHTVVPGLAGVAAAAGTTVPPHWRVIGHAGTWWWHDPRTHLYGTALPLLVSTAPGVFHHYQSWQIPLTVDGRPVAVDGSLDWVPAHTDTGMWVLAAVLLAGFAVIGRLTLWSRPLVVGLVLVTVADVVHAASSVGARVGSLVDQLGALPGDGVLVGLIWLMSIGAAVAAWRHRPAAAYLGLLGAGLTVMIDALPSAGVLWHSQAVTTLARQQDRLLLAVIIGVGSGTAVACALLLGRLDPAPPPTWNPAAGMAAAPEPPHDAGGRPAVQPA